MTDQYTWRIDQITEEVTEDIRSLIANKIRGTIHANQECFIAQFILQNPEVNLKHMKLCHGFKGDFYEFWIEFKEDV